MKIKVTTVKQEVIDVTADEFNRRFGPKEGRVCWTDCDETNFVVSEGGLTFVSGCDGDGESQVDEAIKKAQVAGSIYYPEVCP